MSDVNYLPLSFVDHALIAMLMDEEELAWLAELGWDYSPVRQILTSFLRQNLLPGWVAVGGPRALVYAYFLTHNRKGIVGTLFASKFDGAQGVADEVMRRVTQSLKESPTISRIEAQIMPFNNLNLTAGFTRLGFSSFPRYFLELDLSTFDAGKDALSSGRVIPWDPSFLAQAAEIVALSYRGECDAEICEDYRTVSGCTAYLRSIIENPGCGLFLPSSSFLATDEHGVPCGFVMSSRISADAGMIPQIAVHPARQASGIGRELILRCFNQLRLSGYRSVGLTVTKKNRKAFEWYQRLGFRIRKEFGAYVWQRN